MPPYFVICRVSDTQGGRERGTYLHHSPGFYLFKSTMEKEKNKSFRRPLEINAMSLIMATHAAPEVQGVTRVGSGIVLELISLSVHESREAGQLAQVSRRRWERTPQHPPPPTHHSTPSPSAPTARDYHLFTCPSQWALLCSKIRERGEEDFDLFFFSLAELTPEQWLLAEGVSYLAWSAICSHQNTEDSQYIRRKFTVGNLLQLVAYKVQNRPVVLCM